MHTKASDVFSLGMVILHVRISQFHSQARRADSNDCAHHRFCRVVIRSTSSSGLSQSALRS